MIDKDSPSETMAVTQRTADRVAAVTRSESDKVTVYRVVVGFLLVSLLWKIRFVPMFYSIYQKVPLRDEFFPALMQSTEVMTCFYLVPIVLGISVMCWSARWLILTQASLTTLSMLGLCIHQQTFNDVTFMTCFWASAWCLWYALRMGDPADELRIKAGRLSVLIVSMVFLGGAVGKLTPGYWSGEVLYQIYFVDRDFWFFNLLRSQFDMETLRTMATYYSRIVIATEMACAFLWLLPTRMACFIAIGVLLSIAIFSNFLLFSVMSCLFGLGIAGLHQPGSADSRRGQSIFQSRPMSKLIAE